MKNNSYGYTIYDFLSQPQQLCILDKVQIFWVKMNKNIRKIMKYPLKYLPLFDSSYEEMSDTHLTTLSSHGTIKRYGIKYKFAITRSQKENETKCIAFFDFKIYEEPMQLHSKSPELRIVIHDIEIPIDGSADFIFNKTFKYVGKLIKSMINSSDIIKNEKWINKINKLQDYDGEFVITAYTNETEE